MRPPTGRTASGLYLEAELGEVGGKDGAHAPGVRTDPAEAAASSPRPVSTRLAVAVGSSHAMSQRTALLDFDLIAKLRSAVPVPLVLHGSSGVRRRRPPQRGAAGITKSTWARSSTSSLRELSANA